MWAVGGPSLEERVQLMAKETNLTEPTVFSFMQFLFKVDEMFKPLVDAAVQSVPERIEEFMEEQELVEGAFEEMEAVDDGSGEEGLVGEEGLAGDAEGECLVGEGEEVKVAKKRGRKASVPSAQPEILVTPVKRVRKR